MSYIHTVHVYLDKIELDVISSEQYKNHNTVQCMYMYCTCSLLHVQYMHVH